MTLREKIKFRLVGLLGSLLVRLIVCTLRVRVIGDDSPPGRGPGGRIYCFWHSQLLSLAYLYRNRKIIIMASRHRDAEYIVQVTRRLGFGSVRGSSTRGGARALTEALSRLAEGADLAVTPDGPRGPRQQVKPGTLFLARQSGAPIVPGAAVPQRAWRLNSWDGFYIPKPFSRLAVVIGEPIYLAGGLGEDQMEAERLHLEQVLNDLTDKAARMALDTDKH